MKTVGSRRQVLTWRVIAVDATGQGHGDCGHNHVAQMDAVRCRWAPPGWDQMLVCDLLVRQVRDSVASGDREYVKR
jgi:hypothetical protein